MDKVINAERIEQIISVFGNFDENVKRIEQTFDVHVTNRGTELKVSGEPEAAEKAGKAIEGLLTLAAKGETIDEQKVRYLIDLVNTGNEDQIGEMAKDVVCITAKGKPIKAKTLGQQRYMKAIMNNTITIGVGPAGTGKTYLAVAAAVSAFRSKQVNRIILTRPAVEAGERLGFLPGDLQSKVDPYLRPLYDALFEMLGPDTYANYLERGNIEVAPLAYMRGRTLDDSFIILDEAQNTSREQMKMFLTRLGFGSKIVITGDITQIDLPADKTSGLKEAMRVLEGVEDVAVCRLGAQDVVRHVLVQRIIDAYEKYGSGGERRQEKVTLKMTASKQYPELDARGFRRVIRKAFRRALEAEGVTAACQVDVLITDDDGIRQINRSQRGIDSPTDVLSFPMQQLTPGAFAPDMTEADPDTGLLFLGSMAVSADRIREQAERFGHSAEHELAYLSVHSCLHLLGYDHLDEGPEKARMRGREKEIMARIGL